MSYFIVTVQIWSTFSLDHIFPKPFKTNYVVNQNIIVMKHSYIDLRNKESQKNNTITTSPSSRAPVYRIAHAEHSNKKLKIRGW